MQQNVIVESTEARLNARPETKRVQDIAWWKRREDAYETAIAELLPTVWTALPADLPSALPALESVAWMTRHAWVTGWQSYSAVSQHWQRSGVGEDATRRPPGKGTTTGGIHCSSAGVAWRLLDSCYVLGEHLAIFLDS